ncbi:O-antigen ligase family protein [Aquihabitans sp. G128]|uniref:O-antigen ligase family protein n=1 Tax=Aquihabitans sp. G128 TaxID=2849779 RepID=UPI001C21BA15|nr:O-antigen ligase family protein [Aquihabitans sp. G128]QXC62729.1 O-antigen ligase family protein [Aquihabitans sp. G128]
MGDRWGTWVLAALAPAAFLALDPGGWYPFGPAKWLAVSVLLPLGAGGLLARRRARFEPRLGVAVVVLLAFLVLGAAVGLDPTYAWIGTPERQLGVVTWALLAVALLAGTSLDPDGDAGPLLVGLAAAAVGVGGVAAAEAVGWAPGPVGLGGSRLTGTFGSAAYLGAASALLLPIAAGTAADRRLGRPLRATAAVGAVLVGVACVGAGTRSAWVGLAAAAGATAVARRRGLRRERGRAAPIAALGLAALAVVVVATPVGGRLSSAFDERSPGGIGRLDEWRVAARVIAEHPVTGVGPEGYRVAFASGVDERYQREHGRDPLPDRAHSAPLDVALAGGVGAGLAWLAVAGLIGRFAWRGLRRGRPWVVGLAAGVVAHGVGELFLFPTSELDPVAWLLGGLLVAATADPGELRTWGRPADRGASPARHRGAPRPVPAVLGLVAIVALAAGATGVVADRHAAAAARALARRDGAVAAAQAASASRLRPDVLRYRLLEARARVAAGEGSLAGLRAVDDGLAVSPGDPIARLARARLLVARAEATEVPAQIGRAQHEVDRLLAEDPLSGELWLLAGELGRLDDRPAAAERAWRRAARLLPRDPVAPTQLALLYLAADRRADARRAIRAAVAIAPTDPAVRRAAERIGPG